MRRSDAELAALAREGDREAFGELLARFRDAVYGVAFHCLGDHALAEDITQEAFVQAYLRLGQLREPGKFGHWLFVVTRNLCRQHLRARRTAGGQPPTATMHEGPEHEAAARDLVHRALSSIPPDNGLAVTLYHVDGYTYEEVAGFLGVPTTTVKGRIERGRRQLREEMVRMMEEHLEQHKPSEELGELVLQRISAADVWALSPAARGESLRDAYLLINGALARRRSSFERAGSSTYIEASASFMSTDGGPLCVFQSWSHPLRYYVFGKARVEPNGPVIENTVVHVTPRLQAGSGPPPGVDAWRPESVSSKELWAMPPERRDPWLYELYRRSHGPVLLDGNLASHRLTNGGPGAGTCSGAREVFIRNRGPHRLNVFQATWPEVKYYVFGEAEAVPPGLRVENAAISMEAVVERQIVDEPGDDVPDIPAFTAEDLWGLDAQAQYEQLGGSWLAVIDGQLCRVKVTGGQGTNLVARAQLTTTSDEPVSVYELVGDANRYYLFGEARVEPGGALVDNCHLTASVEVPAERAPAAAPAGLVELSSTDLCAMPPEERERHLREVFGNVWVLLDGGPAEGMLLFGQPGGSCGTPGGEVRFRNVGDGSLHVYRREWPDVRYFVFGEAEVTPPGLRARDVVVALKARR